ncbi:MAG TPA: endolytic transglycosylase MltG [Acidiferrobacterales bacterium]|nr:endolytic transglycosylase MltG [Acidiferrobacterales bacterium]
MAKSAGKFTQNRWQDEILRSPAKLLLTGLVALLLIAAIYLYWLMGMHLHPGETSYVVQPGTTLRSFARELHQQGILPDSHSLVWLAYIKGRSRDLKAGEYRFRAGITPLELLDQVVSGRVVEYPLALIEGWTFKQSLEAINVAPKLTHTLQGLRPEEIMRKLGYGDIHPEGRFYPDTYYYSMGTSDLMLLRQAYKKMELFLQKEWSQRAPQLPFKTPDEALILASIVEKETAQPDERKLIAGVFINRLRRGMRLQTDPSVIYGMGDQYRGNIRLQDLRGDTPYNTYVRYGLPPTPIAMPGAEAIHAVLNPAETKALYFVSRGDGSHVFSGTLEEHNKAVIKYQLGGKPKSFSSHPLPAKAP